MGFASGPLSSLICFWDFQEAPGEPRQSRGQYQYALGEMAGKVQRVTGGIFGPYAAELQPGQWFAIDRSECGALNLAGRDAQVSVVAWVWRTAVVRQQALAIENLDEENESLLCQAVAGLWDETRQMRQYCLFLDLGYWGGTDRVGGHVSPTGGPTPGWKYSRDVALGRSRVPLGRWQCAAFTYNGEWIRVYLNGSFDSWQGRNPYRQPDGIFDPGADGASFTVGAVSRAGNIGNFLWGRLGGLAVFRKALSGSEIVELQRDPYRLLGIDGR